MLIWCKIDGMKLKGISQCCLCNRSIESEEFDATPIEVGTCCHNCHEKLVIPARKEYEDALRDYEADCEEFAWYEAEYITQYEFKHPEDFYPHNTLEILEVV